MIATTLFLLAAGIRADAPAAPSRQPQLAALDGQVAMTFGAGSTVYFASSPDKGSTFAAPVKVGEVDALMLGRHRGPRLAITANALVISAVSSSSGNILVWRSVDKGRSWTRAGLVNDTPTSAREGLHAMAADSRGNLVAAWLDLRQKSTRLYGARSTDGGLTWSKNFLVYESPSGTICQCCHPSIAIDNKGRVSVMWRNALEGSRDLYVTSAADGVHFDQARKLGEGTWKLEACPMDGGGLASENGNLYSAWRRDGEVFVTGPDGVEKKLGAGKDVAIARGATGTYVAWTQDGGIRAKTPTSTGPLALAQEGGFVNLLRLPNGGVLAAWETKDSIETALLK